MISQPSQHPLEKLSFEYRHPYAHLTWMVRFLPWVLGISVLLLLPKVDFKTYGPGSFILILALGFPVILALTLVAHLSHRAFHTPKKLSFTDEFIFYQTAFYQIQTRWENLERVTRTGEQVVVLLNKPAEVIDSFLFGPTEPERTHIPLDIFVQTESDQEQIRQWFLQKQIVGFL